MTQDGFEFPQRFIWGTATAAYQVEGAAHTDGRGPSIWDTFAHTAGRIANGDNGDIACDHYHRWQDDIKLMQALNINAYRFSIAWPRIYPQGRETLNRAGLDFYDRLVDGLLDAGIAPYATLYHWDLPQVLQDEEGWLRRGIIEDYLAYTDTVSRRLGDRVKHWITFNEPWVFTWLGYVIGVHAPGMMTGNPNLALTASHHVLLAHGRAVSLLRANVPNAEVGITLNVVDVQPASDSAADQAAVARFDGHHNRWYLDPIFKGQYPEDMVNLYSFFMPEIQPGDMAQIAAPVDFLGLNYYTRHVIADEPEQMGLALKQIEQPGEHTAMNWEVYPDGLNHVLKRIDADYGPAAIYVTENGAAYVDEVTADGQVHDTGRTAYLRGHLAAAARALAEGVPLKGYFAWSLFDNFEWAEGYDKRFGLYYVDFATQARILKDSGKFFAQVADRVGLPAK